MRFVQVLTALGGVAPVRRLLERGISRRELSRALDGGEVVRVRRGIIATPQAPADFIAAVTLHARLTCVSAADRAALRRDRRRNNTAMPSGYAVLRFCYEDVMYHQSELLAQVLSAV